MSRPVVGQRSRPLACGDCVPSLSSGCEKCNELLSKGNPTNMKKLQLFFAAVSLTAFLAAPARAASSYTVDTTGNCWTGAHTISAADSGMTSAHYAVSVYNGAIAPANR